MKRLLLVIALTAGLGGLFLFGLLRGPPDRDIPSNLLGKPVPAFDLPLHTPYLAEYGPTFAFEPGAIGRPVVINFWAQWCAPCRYEAPVLQQAWQEYGDQALILGIQTQDRGNQAKGLEFIREFGLTFPSVIDDDSRTSIDYGLAGVPETFFIRADGTLAYKHAGPVTPELMDAKLRELLD